MSDIGKVKKQLRDVVGKWKGAGHAVNRKDRQIASLTASLKAAEEEVTRLKSVLSSDEEQMKVLVNRNAALRDAAVIKHQEDEIVVQKMRSERDALKAEVAELRYVLKIYCHAYKSDNRPPADVQAKAQELLK